MGCFTPQRKSVLRLLILTCALSAASWAAPAHADLFNVDFNDPVGPHWTGIVDTSADTLTINTWVENSGGHAFWTASPLVWQAVNAGGGPYDVPDTFGASLINASNWGFLSPVTHNEISWNEGTYPELDVHVGWGVGRLLGEYHLSGTTGMSYVPVTEPGPPEYVAVVHTNTGIVTVSAVPEPSSFSLCLGLVVGLGLVGRRRRRTNCDPS